MTILEKKSERKKKAIYYMVKNGEMAVAYALDYVEKLNDEGKLLDKDYEELATYLESLLEPTVEETVEENSAETAENTTENTAEEETQEVTEESEEE